ncbi:MAG: methionyl-tRNA formyltransferase [Bacteroidales bacterium]|nr:methionyl-tRNA formyltransferase [Bacteroidales bacterium]
MRIIFMGTPEIAVYSLDKLDNSNHEIVAVVTVPDKPAGRGQKLRPSVVKQYAEKNNIKVLQPEKLKNPEFISELKKINADLFVVLAFRMLPKEVWTIPPKGTINLHASLLPNYRGAAPINWAIINGETKTGVTTFFIDDKVDTGKIIDQKEIEITRTDNAETLHDKIMILGAELLLETVNSIENDTFKEIPQDKLVSDFVQLKAAPKIFKENCKIDWNQNLNQVYNFIRGLNPYPGAWTNLEKEGQIFFMKIFDIEELKSEKRLNPGIIFVDKNCFRISCLDGFIIVKTMQLEGKKKMESSEFLRGFNLTGCKLI